MHLLIPYAHTCSDAATAALRDLALPSLAGLLQRLDAAARDDGDEYSLSPPHERALAASFGWLGGEGTLPFAARAAAADGIEVGSLAWGQLTPVHWHVGRDHISLADPQALALEADESRALFEAVRELFESSGFKLVWGAPLRWYAAHDSLNGLPCAALDRVIGRNVDLWLPGSVQGRAIRRLQSELQLLLYPHPINEAREARGELPVNSFWLSGCGTAQPTRAHDVEVDDTLRAPALLQDSAAWAAAWQALDRGVLAGLLASARDGLEVSLTLCGERSAQRFDVAPRAWWQRLGSRWSAPLPQPMLEGL